MSPGDAPSGAPTVTLAKGEGPHGAFTLATGTVLGPYVIVGRLGAGGMGAVYLAYDARLARRVAIKVLHPDAEGADAHARMLREAQTMARLTHPNVLAVYDVGEFGDGVFIATEYIEGHTLRSWLDERRGWRDVLAVLKAAGRGLEAAHAAGIVHRDFKPDNVFLGNDGRVVVGDFGIARAIARAQEATPPAETSLRPGAEAQSGANEAAKASGAVSGRSLHGSAHTLTGTMVGSVGYMSPERAFDGRDDPRSDQFSFCVTLHRALYGQAPFVYSGLSTYLDALLEPPRPPPEERRVPSWIHDVVLRGIAYEPSARFESMTALLRALDRDPTRRRLGWTLGACALGLSAVMTLGWARHRQNVRNECRGGESLIAATWGPDARAKVGAGITATAVPLASDYAARTQGSLDAYAAEWARVHREASEATLLRAQDSAQTMKDRLTCLDGERDELAALVDVLSRADAVVARNAISAAYGLPLPRACLEPRTARAASLAAETPERRGRVTALRRSVAEAEAQRMTGKFDAALNAATRALVEARAIPHRQSEAELLFLVAASKRELEDDAVARISFEEAFAASEAAGNDSLAAIAAATISLELSDSLADTRGAERWLATAKGIREREGPDDRAEAEVLEAEIQLGAIDGHADRVLVLRDRLIALLQRLYGASHPRIAVAIANRGYDLASAGKPDLAVVEFRRAIAMQELLFGPDVPFLSIYYNNLGSALTQSGRYAEGQGALQRALALVAPLGATSPHNVLPLASLAELENRIGDRDAALTAAERAIAIVDASGESEVRLLPALLVQQGLARLAKGDAAAAHVSCTRALALEEKRETLEPDKIQPDWEDALTCLGEAETALGPLERALAHLERSVSLTKREMATDLSLARFALARALTAAKRDPKRARDLAEAAGRELRAAPGMEREAREAESWLGARR